MKLQPIHDRLIVRRLGESEEMVGGIIIPDAAREKPQQGEVVAAGEGKVREDGSRQPLTVKAGDRILFGKYAGQEISLSRVDYLILREDEVLAIMRDE